MTVMAQPGELLDFGGKYLYLLERYHKYVHHDALVSLAFRSIVTLTLTLGFLFVLILFSPFARPPVIKPAGCRRYGVTGSPALHDEHSSKYTKGGRTIKVHSLYIYPVKSTSPVSLDRAQIVPTGFKYDRQFSFAQLHSPFPLSASDSKAKKTAHQWRFITQREFPLLSQVSSEVWVPDHTSADYSEDNEYVQSDGAIIIRFPWEEEGLLGWWKSFIARCRGQKTEKAFILPFLPTDNQRSDCKIEDFKIWKDIVPSLNMSRYVPPELKYFLGVRNPLTLFRVEAQREIFRNAPRKQELGWQPITGFADAYPLNILSLSSVQALTAMQPGGYPKLSIRRFRGNIAITGSTPFQEEEWKKIKVGKAIFHVCCRCVRCGIPNIDPATGIKNRQEPYKTLTTKRNVDKGSPKEGCMGMQLVPVNPQGWVCIGDEVQILECGEHVYEEM